MKIITICLLTLLTGCSGTPFIEGTAGYSVNLQRWEKDGKPQHYLCRGAFQIKTGFDYESYSIGFAHDSNWDCGPPFNDKKEFFRDFFFISKRWGGK